MQDETEMKELLTDVKSRWAGVAGLPGEMEKLRGATEKLEQELREVRRLVAGRGGEKGGPRPAGGVSRDCAEQVAAHYILHVERSGNPKAEELRPWTERFRFLQEETAKQREWRSMPRQPGCSGSITIWCGR